MPSVTAPLIRAELSLNDQAIGVLQGPAFVVLYAIALLVAGHWLRSIDARRLATGAVLIWTAGGVLFALSPTFFGLVCGRALLGVGQAAFIPAALLLIGQETGDARRARGLSVFTAGSAAGRSVALLIGALILSILGPRIALGFTSWRIMCLVMVLPNLVLALLVLRIGRRDRVPQRRGVGLADALRTVVAAPGRLLGLAFACAGTVLVVQAAGAWAPTILHRNFGLGVPDSALVFGAVVLVFAPAGHLFGGWLASGRPRARATPDRMMVWALCIAAGCAAALALVGDVASAATALIGLTLAGGTATGLGMILFQSQIDVPLRGSVSALFLALTSTIGVGAGPWITGALSDALGREQGLVQALAITVGLGTLCVALLARIFGARWRCSAIVAPIPAVAGGRQ